MINIFISIHLIIEIVASLIHYNTFPIQKECHIIAERRIQEVKDLCKHEKLTSEQILKKQFKQDLNDLNSLLVIFI